MALFTQKAVKEKLHARVAIDGPTGSGKTWTALQWATILAQGGPIGVIDTENRSAAYYAPAPESPVERTHYFDPPYEFFHLPVTPPFDPRELGKMIDAASDELAPNGVLIIDSLTHYWNGEGGTLDIVDDAATRARGNSFAGWKEGTPAQRYMLDKIVWAPFHVITTMRSKMEYALETGTNGKQVPIKLGLAPEQRSGIEYEFTVVCDMSLSPPHVLTVSKSRCDLLADKVAQKGRSYELAETFLEWLGTGVQRITEDDALLIGGMFNAIPEKAARAAVKRDFIDTFGVPQNMLSDKLDEAREWITARVQAATSGPAVQGPLGDALAEGLGTDEQ